MKTNTLFLLSTLLAMTSLVSAQDYAFKVLAVKGSNEVKSGEAWQPLKTGATLLSQDELKLGANGYIGLVHETGKPLEVKEAGVHKVSVLESKVGTGSSVLHKYTDFILSSNEGGKNRLTATGAVHRGDNDKSAIKLQLPDKDHSGIFNKIAVINWHAGDVAGPYVVKVKNMFEDVLAEIETSETGIELDLGEPKYANETAILIEVSAKANPKLISTQHLIKKLSPAELQKVTEAVKALKQEMPQENALSHLYFASLYEQNGLFIDAIYAYEQAVKLEPEVPAFRESYQEFLTRTGLK